MAVAVLLFCGVGCGSTRPFDKAPPDKAPPPAAAKQLLMVEEDAPFIVDWDAKQMGSLTDVVRSPNKGAVVVAYERNVARILPNCHLTGVYVPSGIGMYRGMLQVRRSDARNVTAGLRTDALQQISTSSNVPGGALFDYRFVVVGRHHLGQSRTSARTSDLAGGSADACVGATHFVRAALVGAFERVKTPQATLGSGDPAPMLTSRGGDFTQCLVAGSVASEACSAFLKIELTALLPAAATEAPPAPAATLPAPTAAATAGPVTAPVIPTSVRPAATTVPTANVPVPATGTLPAPVGTMPVLIPVPKPAPAPAPAATP